MNYSTQVTNTIGDTQLISALALDDFSQALRLSPQNALLLYNRGNMQVERRQFAEAVDSYTQALQLEPDLAEAYYNRGLSRISLDQKAEGIADLSKAGELGLYAAYSIIKKYTQEQKKK